MAAYLVFVSHFAYIFDENFPHSVQRFLNEFHIGVTIFFVLSGFLIAFRYYDSFKLTKDWFKQYLKNRVARIYPMYAILTIASFIAFYFTHDTTVTAGKNPVIMFLLNIVFLRGFFDQFKFTGIAQGWSLTVEECFYFAAPFVFFIASRYKKFYIQPLMVTFLGVVLVLMFSRINWYGFFGNITFMMLYTFLGRCFEFYTGIQLALTVRKKELVSSRGMKFTYLGFFMIFLCVWIMSILPIPAGQVAGLHSPLGIVTNNYILAISIAFFFYGILTEATLLKKILANPFVELLGKSSYIFYLIHLGFMYNMVHNCFNWLNDHIFILYDKWGLNWHSPFEYDSLNLLYAFIVLNACSIVLYKFIEEPLNHQIRRSDFLIKSKVITN